MKKYTMPTGRQATKNYKSRWRSPDKVVDSRRNRSHRGSTTTRSSGQTQKLGEKLAKEILLSPTSHNLATGGAVIIGLSGNLGGGKTTFLQGFAKGLGIKEKILSPTFVILKHFKISEAPLHIKCPTAHFIYKKQFCNFYHIDCYRLKNEKDILELGLKDILENPENIVAIEWPDKIKKVLPKNTIFINFKFIDNKTREINFKHQVSRG